MEPDLASDKGVSALDGYSDAITRLDVLNLFITFLCGFTLVLSMTYVPLHAYALNASEIEIGFITAGYSLTYIVMPIVLGRMYDKLGSRTMILCGTAILSMLYVLYFLVSQPLLFILLKAVEGVGYSFMWPSLMASLAGSLRKLKGYNMMWSTGSIAAPLVGGVIAQEFMLKDIFLMTASFMIVSFVLGLMLSGGVRKKAGQNDTQPVKASGLNRKHFSLFLFPFIYGFTLLMVSTFFPIYSLVKGIGVIVAGYILTVSNFGRLLAFIAPAKIQRQFNNMNALRLSILATGLIPALIIFQNEPYILYLEFFAIGALTGVAYASMQKRILGIDEQRKGYYAGIQEAVIGVGFLVGPILGGIVASLDLNYVFILPLAFTLPILIVSMVSSR